MNNRSNKIVTNFKMFKTHLESEVTVKIPVYTNEGISKLSPSKLNFYTFYINWDNMISRSIYHQSVEIRFCTFVSLDD